jgi:adenine-specific DNA methylase
VPYRKKLIEVALPLETINAESAREKPFAKGTPTQSPGDERLWPTTIACS